MTDPGWHDTTSNSSSSAVTTEAIVDVDWEEWDGNSPFWMHCVAGSLAGVLEHTIVYPLDTVRTNLQAICSACARQAHVQQQRQAAAAAAAATSGHCSNKTTSRVITKGRVLTWMGQMSTSSPSSPSIGMMQTMRFLFSEPLLTTPGSSTAVSSVPPSLYNQTSGKFFRLWRGVQTMFIGCIPAHALYFSSYETVKLLCTDPTTHHVSYLGSTAAGAAAVLGHDVIMTPLDTLKQRLQLGHYGNHFGTALRSMVRNPNEGWWALYRSFPITLATNLPYGMIMVSTNEAFKETLTAYAARAHHANNNNHYVNTFALSSWQIIVLSSSLAGLLASALTTPLDRIKTALQTQELMPACLQQQPHCPIAAAKQARINHSPLYNLYTTSNKMVSYSSWHHAARHVYDTEGWRGFTRGMLPRILSHTPAVAISWTTYETAKAYLLQW